MKSVSRLFTFVTLLALSTALPAQANPSELDPFLAPPPVEQDPAVVYPPDVPPVDPGHSGASEAPTGALATATCVVHSYGVGRQGNSTLAVKSEIDFGGAGACSESMISSLVVKLWRWNKVYKRWDAVSVSCPTYAQPANTAAVSQTPCQYVGATPGTYLVSATLNHTWHGLSRRINHNTFVVIA